MTQFGIQIGYLGGPLADMRALWRFADDSGFSWFSVSDHFRESPPRGGGDPCFESLTTLTLAAAETSKVRLGTLVAAVGYRNPGVMAKAFTTLDHISNGRVECGVGMGWSETEYAGFGIPFPVVRERADQLDEYVQVLRLLFDEDRADFAGNHFRLQDATNFPKPVQRRLPICVGGTGEKRTLPLVARRADVWNASMVSPDEFRAKSEIIDRLCEREGRDPAEIARTLNIAFYMGVGPNGVTQAEARFGREWGTAADRLGLTGFIRGSVDDALRAVEAYVSAGAERIILSLRQGPYDWAALEAFASAVMSRF